LILKFFNQSNQHSKTYQSQKLMKGIEICLLLEEILIDPFQCQKLLLIENLEYYLPQVKELEKKKI